MKKVAILFSAVLMLLAASPEASAQSDEVKKFEVGAQFSSLSLDESGDTRTEPGFGGRLTFNLTDNVALEAEGNFFPHKGTFRAFRSGGRAAEGLFGVKIGKRFQRFGIFAKARPGFISFSEGIVEFFPNTQTATSNTVFDVRARRLTHFAADLGGVLEFYPSRRIFTRIDLGDTIIHYGRTSLTAFTAIAGGPFVAIPFTLPDETKHNFQFSAGVGFRF